MTQCTGQVRNPPKRAPLSARVPVTQRVGQVRNNPETMSQLEQNSVSPEPMETAARVPVLLLPTLVVALLTLAGITWRYESHGDFNLIHAALCLFFAINLLVCYWEICLFVQRDYIETRTEYWRERQRETGRRPVAEFFLSSIPLRRALSPTIWADVWATYAQFDGSHADRRTFGFIIDVTNGVFTAIPTLILFAAFTVQWLPAVVTGLIGLALFWQQAYGTIVYFVSFYVAKRHRQIGRVDFVAFVLASNVLWLVFPALGGYVSLRLILEGNYNVLGF